MLPASITKLKNAHALTPDKQWARFAKHTILAEISSRQENRLGSKLSFSDQARLFTFKFGRKFIPNQVKVITAALIVLMMVSTGVIAQAAVPGDVLWPMKITMEKAEVVLAMDPASESRVHIRHVENRLKELTTIASQPDTTQKAENISQVVRRLEKDITAANQSLKITKEEKKDTQPQIILALAKDLNDKASEAVKVLEQNKQVLISATGQDIVDQIDSVGSTTSTLPLVAVQGSLTSESTSTPSKAQDDQDASKKKKANIDAKQVITDVQIVNEYISYDALAAMIEVIERNGQGNRSEVSYMLLQRINEQREKLESINEVIKLVNDNFLLHRTESTLNAKNADKALTKAKDYLVLDNLGSALASLNDAKDLISRTAKILREVSTAGGLKPRSESIEPRKEIAPTRPVTIQTMPVETTTESIVDDSLSQKK